MSNQYDAEDVLQTTALKAARNFHKLKSMKDAKTWLFSIATNAMNDHYRRTNEKVSIDQLPEAASAESVSGYSDLKFTLHHYLERLPAEKQSLFHLYMQRTLNLKEIAGVLNIGYSTARKWLQEIKDDLAQELYDKAQ